MPILWTLHRSQWKIALINQCQKISYPIQKLRENNVEGIDIMQISGHKNVAFINNYSTLSEERHKKISNILSTN
jgi:23S rRNA U2552 (ribose-2'-O)-methylase RlmE/FtsJ